VLSTSNPNARCSKNGGAKPTITIKQASNRVKPKWVALEM
jgi:hypothetical protein